MQESKPTVLVVEDEDSVRNLIVTILRLSGFEALHCGDGAGAHDLMDAHGGGIRLLVTDVNLGPESGGVEMARELLARFPHLRVLYISGLSDGYEVEQEVQAGRAHFIAKPFTPKGLAAAVAAILDDRFRLEPGGPVRD